MPVLPQIPKPGGNQIKKCEKCGRALPASYFSITHCRFYTDGRLPVCDECISNYIQEGDGNWERIDKVCQWADIPFIVKEWDRVSQITVPSEAWSAYAKVFSTQEYESIGWGDYYRQYKKLKETGFIEEEIPEVREKRYSDLRRKWGENYDEEELNHLEDLYKGLLNTQNINGAL